MSKNITIAIVVAIILLLGGVGLFMANGNPEDGVLDNRYEDKQALGETNIKSGNQGLNELEWIEYQNDEVGIEFSYPENLAEGPIGFHNGSLSGRTFYGRFVFPSGNWFAIAIASSDYQSERDWNWSRARGYKLIQGDHYIISPANDKKVLPPVTLWPLNDGHDNALVLYKNNFPKITINDFYAPDLLVVVNLLSSEFPALGIEYLSASAENISPEELSVIEEIVRSIKFK